MSDVDDALVALSKWIDAGNSHRDPEAITWGRLAKVSEECGEVIAAYIGATGQNPRKGVTHTIDDVIEELLDVAVTALGAIEHLTGHDGLALSRLDGKIVRVARRAQIAAAIEKRDNSRPLVVGIHRPCARVGFDEMWDGHRWVPVCLICGDEAAYCDGPSRHR